MDLIIPLPKLSKHTPRSIREKFHDRETTYSTVPSIRDTHKPSIPGNIASMTLLKADKY